MKYNTLQNCTWTTYYYIVFISTVFVKGYKLDIALHVIFGISYVAVVNECLNSIVCPYNWCAAFVNRNCITILLCITQLHDSTLQIPHITERVV